MSSAGSGGEYSLILTSETIYRQDSLRSLIRLLDEGASSARDDGVGSLVQESEELSLQDGSHEKGPRKVKEPQYLCLVAAKVLYFGVGGGISDFIEAVQNRESGRSGVVSTILEKTAGVGRKVLQVEWRS